MLRDHRLNRFPFAHTFSIVARDPDTGDMGVAVQSHWFATGSMVIWGEAGIGVVATQAMVETGYGPLGLEGMRSGKTSKQVLDQLLREDAERDLRQVAMLDRDNHVAVHTGARCIASAGHTAGNGFSVQANMMANDMVWPAMAHAYTASRGGLADRILASLEAAQAAGGDIRGQQSAAILVVKGKTYGRPWDERLIDLRVDDHSQPIAELKRLIKVNAAYKSMNKGDDLLGKGKTREAMQAYRSAALLLPDQMELHFWEAVTLADLGNFEDAVGIFRLVFEREPAWKELLKRLPAGGLIGDENDLVARIIEGTEKS